MCKEISDRRFKNFKTRSISIRFFCKNLDFDFRSEFLLHHLRHFSDTCLWSIINGRPIRRSEISKIGTHQKVGESAACTVRFRFVCGRHAACQINWCIHNSTAHGEHLAATVTRARCCKQTGGEGVRDGSAVGQPISLIFASYRRSFDVYSGRVCTACMRWPRC